MELEKILESYPKHFGKIHRNIALHLDKKTCIYGASGIGKTEAVLSYYAKTEWNPYKKMYLNLRDSHLCSYRILESLPEFLQENDIDILILDHFNPSVFPITILDSIANTPQITIISQFPFALNAYTLFEMPPIIFQEFTKIHKTSLDESLNLYLKFGNLLEAESLNEYKKGDFLRILAGDSTNFWILQNLILHLGQKVSLHQIFTKLKKEGKLSKDRFYEYCKALNESKMLFWLTKFEHESAPKKLYFWDFTLKNTISYQRNFGLLFENMIFLELLYRFQEEVYYTDKLDFYLPNLSLGILCAPFIQSSILEERLHKITKEREFCDSFLILSLNHKKTGENLGMPYKILPFEEFALMDSLV
ncbi:ATP-binding protein [Helicobacter sp. MIT 05-5294]|uniref:ATP-binding protein n=1 Tax=Helicobacter sp. MIT 05-5294 TaxID=1548150 RepID=UPI0010FE402D|nr:ATP-binding protein [Helicobacter sp. MIT 05-5294]TLD87837.1 ATP-binding protein [Helicobacter sp. MIT 05-5294]